MEPGGVPSMAPMFPLPIPSPTSWHPSINNIEPLAWLAGWKTYQVLLLSK